MDTIKEIDELNSKEFLCFMVIPNLQLLYIESFMIT